MKHELFNKQLQLIKNDGLRTDVITMLDLTPDYFYRVPASSTGKYHPQFSLGDRGLMRHVKAAVQIAEELLQLDQFRFSDLDKDLIYSGLILHDCLKHGMSYSQYTCFEHPMYMGNYIEEIYKQNKLVTDVQTLNRLILIIKCHMGQWNTSKMSNVVLPIPITECEQFVHLCDYISSRRFLDVKFDCNDEIIDE